MINQDIDRAAQKAGIADSFANIDGSQQFTSIETKVSLLAAMNDLSSYPPSDAIDSVRASYVFRLGQSYQIQLDNIAARINWQIKCENQNEFQGSVSDSAEIIFPAELEMGYHRLTLEIDHRHYESRLIVVPQRCYEPQVLLEGQKIWGLSIQLYTLRSETNWGMGDFGDLHALIDEISQRGGCFIGLNPIHALYPANPDSVSPYSPSSRKWLNVLYIDVNSVDEFQQSEDAQAWWNSPLTQEKLNHARDSEWVDYRAVSSLKMQALRLAFNYFQTQQHSERQDEFERFIEKNGESLRQQATFDAVHLALNIGDENRWGWPVWPEEFRDNQSEAVKQFHANNQSEILFFSWLQWLAHVQLKSCYEHCVQNNMSIGLYRDLAVGVSEGGADIWSEKNLYATAASIGAPPDPLGPLGQNWGLPPLNPHIMQERAYQPFIELLQSNMSYCGAIRIDHVMALLRLWWIPYGQTADRGAYVNYPVDDLLGILALESHRHQCMVIGEDLGTVPDEIIDKLHDNGVYSYRVLYFQQGGNDDFFLPQDYTRQAMATITTHDLPTLRSFWLSNDLTLGSQLNLYPDRYNLYSLYNKRTSAKRGLLEALTYAGYPLDEDRNVTITLPMSGELSLAILRYMASSHSLLLGLQFEDLLGTLLPVNIPGTSEEYANWRRKLRHSISEIFSDTEINHLLDEVNQIRRALNL